MNMLSQALKGRAGKDESKTDVAPPTQEMPGEGSEMMQKPDHMQMIMQKLQSDPKLMAAVMQLLESSAAPGAEMSEESEGDIEDEGMGEMDEHMTEGLSETDKMDMGSRKPRSLGERAKMAALERVGKKPEGK